jgi:hypothetical protein
LFAVLVAAAVFLLFGLTAATSILIALVLVCPALVVWGAFVVRQAAREKGRRGTDG